jgi:hypothetical protein
MQQVCVDGEEGDWAAMVQASAEEFATFSRVDVSGKPNSSDRVSVYNAGNLFAGRQRFKTTRNLETRWRQL